MNFFRLFHGYLLEKLAGLATKKGMELVDFSKVTVEPPKDSSHGDFSTNAAMVLSRVFKQPPSQMAEEIKEILRAHPHVAEVTIAGPGFVNVRLVPGFWHQQLQEILIHKEGYGQAEPTGTSVNVEYVSVNPTGPMHAGHGRGAVVGDVLAALYEKAGYNVVREYYINDEGGQADVLARSVYLRYLQALGSGAANIPAGLYPGLYLVPVGEALAKKYGAAYVDQPEEAWLDVFKRFAVDEMMVLIKSDLKKIGIQHERFSSERALVEAGRVEEMVKVLGAKGYLYEGVLEAPKGHQLDDWEPRPQLLFRSTDFGDDVDRALKKSDGSWTYFAKDIAYHYDKYTRCGPHMVNVWGADHSGYVKRLQAAVRAISHEKAKVDVVLCSMVNLMDKGQPVKMSKRAGTFVTLDDVVDKVGKDVLRLIMISRKNDAPLDFDFSKVLETSHENPVFYIQYAFARTHSVFRQAQEVLGEGLESLPAGDGLRLTDGAELELIKKLTQWPRLVEQAAVHEEPHRVVYYLHELASLFHSLWNKGKEDPTLRFILAENAELTAARLMLVKATQYVLGSGLDVCGVTPREEM